MKFKIWIMIVKSFLIIMLFIATPVNADQGRDRHCQAITYMGLKMYEFLGIGGNEINRAFGLNVVKNLANEYDRQGGNGKGESTRQFVTTAFEKNIEKEVVVEAIYFSCSTGRTIYVDRLPLCNRLPEGKIPACLNLYF
ncbi:TPA: hypothetical protein ACX6Q5_002763 [Photobacterium damselae]